MLGHIVSKGGLKVFHTQCPTCWMPKPTIFGRPVCLIKLLLTDFSLCILKYWGKMHHISASQFLLWTPTEHLASLLCRLHTLAFRMHLPGCLACMSATVGPRESQAGDIRRHWNFKGLITWHSKLTERSAPPAISVQNVSCSTLFAFQRDHSPCPFRVLSDSLVLIGSFFSGILNSSNGATSNMKSYIYCWFSSTRWHSLELMVIDIWITSCCLRR